MTVPNLPPDVARDIARMRTDINVIKRRFTPPGLTRFLDLDDVDGINANDNDVATYVAATGKIQMKPAGLSVGAMDNFIDTTGVICGTAPNYLPWVLTSGSPFIANAGNITPTTVGGNPAAEIQKAGLYGFSLAVSRSGSPIDFTITMTAVVLRGSDVVGQNGQLFRQASTDVQGFPQSLPLSVACEAGDVVLVQLGTGGGETFMLDAAVSSLTAP